MENANTHTRRFVVGNDKGKHKNKASRRREKNKAEKRGNKSKLDWRRWLMLFIFAFIGAVSGIIFLSLGSVAPQASGVYGVTPTQVSFTGAIFYILFPPMAVVNMIILSHRKHGLYITTVTTAVMQAVGASLRCIDSDNAGGWPWSLFGSVMLGLPNAFLLGSFTTLSSNWFPPHERGTSTTVANVSIAAGMMIGAIMPMMMVDESGPNIPHQLLNLNIAQAVISGASAVLAVLLFRSHPEYDPATGEKNDFDDADRSSSSSSSTTTTTSTTASASTTTSNKKQTTTVRAKLPPPPGLWESIKICLGNGYFIAMTFSIGISLPIYWNLALFIADGMTDRGFSQQEYMIPATLFQGIAIPMIVVAGPLIDWTRSYYGLALSSLGVAFAALVVFAGLMEPNLIDASHTTVLVLIIVVMVIYGAAVNLTVPALLEFAAEATYPAPEYVSTTLMFVVCFLVGLVLFYAYGYLPGNGGNVVNAAAVGVCLLVLAGSWLCSTFIYDTCLKRRTKALVAIQNSSGANASDEDEDEGEEEIEKV